MNEKEKLEISQQITGEIQNPISRGDGISTKPLKPRYETRDEKVEGYSEAWKAWQSTYHKALHRERVHERKMSARAVKLKAKREERKANRAREISLFICKGQKLPDDQLPKVLLKNFSIDVGSIKEAYREGWKLWNTDHEKRMHQK